MVSFSIENVDYTVLVEQTFTADSATSGQRFCLLFSTVDDEIAEGREQFEFYFTNLPNDAADVGDPATVCVDIADDDSMCFLFY